MTQHQLPDHRGVWVIKPPKDMPIAQIAMLQTTIAEFWAEYPGDPNDTELFWDYLTEGMANVPRETSKEKIMNGCPDGTCNRPSCSTCSRDNST